MEPYALMFDVGTSSLKAVLYNRDGGIICQERQGFEYSCPEPRWAEIDPARWLDAFWLCLRTVAERYPLNTLQAMSFTGQMHTAVLLDETGRALSPSILWLDRRAEEETQELEQKFGLPPYVLNSTYTLPKLYWLKKHKPEFLAKAHTLIWPKDYLRQAVTGTVGTDATEGIGAALLNWDTGEWAGERLTELGIRDSLLPEIRPAGAWEKPLDSVAAEYGLSSQLRVYTGYGDIVALLGGAPHRQGRLVYSLGSSSMFFTPVDTAKTGPEGSLYTLSLCGYHLFGGVSNTTGAALSWCHDNLFPELSFEEIGKGAMTCAEGCDGLCFLPYLAGERSPYWSDSVAGGFYGLRLQHSRFHLARAVMEGVAYSILHALDLYAASGCPIQEIALAAGGTGVPGWPQMISDICGVPVSIYAAEETVTKVLFALCRGEAEGEGTFREILEASFSRPERLEPNTQNAAVYAKTYSAYRSFSSFSSTQ